VSCVDTMQQRRDEILAKKARLAELKRQREQRAREVSASRQSIGSAVDVGSSYHSKQKELLTYNS
jgi:dynein intermediate chain